jgi:hypothetical protein
MKLAGRKLFATILATGTNYLRPYWRRAGLWYNMRPVANMVANSVAQGLNNNLILGLNLVI